MRRYEGDICDWSDRDSSSLLLFLLLLQLSPYVYVSFYLIVKPATQQASLRNLLPRFPFDHTLQAGVIPGGTSQSVAETPPADKGKTGYVGIPTTAVSLALANPEAQVEQARPPSRLCCSRGSGSLWAGFGSPHEGGARANAYCICYASLICACE